MPFPSSLRRRFAVITGAATMTLVGGCYDGGIYGASDYASGYACGSNYYDYDPYGYDDGYGYGCYDAGDYRSGFLNIGFGGGWYDDYYYPGSGTWIYDRYNVRRPLSGHYLNYWGGRRAYHRHYQARPDRFRGRPSRPAPEYAPNRPARPPQGWVRPDRPDRGSRPDAARPNRDMRDIVRDNARREQQTERQRDIRNETRERWQQQRREQGTPRAERPQSDIRQPAGARPARSARPEGRVDRPRRALPQQQTRPEGQARPQRQFRQEGQARPERQMRQEGQARGERPARSDFRSRTRGERRDD